MFNYPLRRSKVIRCTWLICWNIQIGRPGTISFLRNVMTGGKRDRSDGRKKEEEKLGAPLDEGWIFSPEQSFSHFDFPLLREPCLRPFEALLRSLFSPSLFFSPLLPFHMPDLTAVLMKTYVSEPGRSPRTGEREKRTKGKAWHSSGGCWVAWGRGIHCILYPRATRREFSSTRTSQFLNFTSPLEFSQHLLRLFLATHNPHIYLDQVHHSLVSLYVLIRRYRQPCWNISFLS